MDKYEPTEAEKKRIAWNQEVEKNYQAMRKAMNEFLYK